MMTLSLQDSQNWVKASGFDLEAVGKRSNWGSRSIIQKYPLPAGIEKLYWFCSEIEDMLWPRDQCVALVMANGIWPSSENLHLYYKFRQSYGDLTLLEDRPGHVFQRFERTDLSSLVQLGICSGWDLAIFCASGYRHAFISHDAFVEFATESASSHVEIASRIGPAVP